MKKTILTFIGVLFVCLLTLTQVKASIIETWNYLPKGNNYLDPNNHNVETLSELDFSFETINPFIIEANKVYSLHALNTTEIINSYTFIFYDSNNNQLMTPSYSEVKDAKSKITGVSFTAPLYTKKVAVMVDFKHTKDMPGGYQNNIDMFFIFNEGQNKPSSNYLYNGPWDLDPVIESDQGLYITNVNDPITASEIKSYLRAYDETDGDVTGSIVVHTDNYTASRFTLGTYYIIFRASDSNNNYTDFRVNIHVVDLDGPTFGGVLNIVAQSSDKLNINDITNGLIISDNYDNVSNIFLELLEDNYSPNYNKVGEYLINYRATDTSGNISEQSVCVIVEDNIVPKINGPMNHTKSNELDVNIQEFISAYTATDDTDGNITSRIKVVRDDYTLNQYNTGVWEIVISVTDDANNTTTCIIEVEVIDNIGPVFFIDRTKIVIDLSENPLNLTTIINSLQTANIIKKDLVIEVLEDTYSENKETPGSYKVLLGYLDQELEVEIEVLNKLPEIEEIEELNFFQKIFRFFGNIWKAILNFFKFLFY